MEENKKSSRSLSEIIAKEMDWPTSSLRSLSHIEIEGNKEAVIEGCGGVCEYNEDSIKLLIGKTKICFTGNNLVIKSFVADMIVLEGTIMSIEFNC